uniref:Uncharacterized protein n=1 Tax=Anopheles braziliensis TaxID=58242 RepID=A0A2M3ZL78_9DIPT
MMYKIISLFFSFSFSLSLSSSLYPFLIYLSPFPFLSLLHSIPLSPYSFPIFHSHSRFVKVCFWQLVLNITLLKFAFGRERDGTRERVGLQGRECYSRADCNRMPRL